jgi:hypothetical protein
MSRVPLAIRNNPAPKSTMSLPAQVRPNRENQGVVSVVNQEIQIKSKIRVLSASSIPAVRAFAWSRSGSLPVTIEIKTTLSIPSTTSKQVNVARLAHVLGSVIQFKVSGSRFEVQSSRFKGLSRNIGNPPVLVRYQPLKIDGHTSLTAWALRAAR